MEFKQRKIPLSNNRMAVILVNHNMDHVIRQHVDYLNRVVEYPIDIFIWDQSTKEEFRFKPKEDDNVVYSGVNYNFYAPLGFNMCLKMADSYAQWNKLEPYKYYLLCSTSGLMDPTGDRTDDIFTPCVKFMEETEDVAMVQPAYKSDSSAMNVHLYNTGTGKPRQVQHIEWCACVFDGEWLRDIGGFETNMLIHGHDIWFCYLARMEGKSMWIHEGVEFKRDQDNGYNNERVSETREERSKRAFETLAPFCQTMLGPNWWYRIWHDYSTDPNWRSPLVLV